MKITAKASVYYNLKHRSICLNFPVSKIENVKFWSFEVLVLLTFCTCGGSSHSGIVSFCKQELEIQAYLFESGLLTEEWRMQIRQHQEWSIKWKKGFSFPYSALGIKSKLWIWSNNLNTLFVTHHLLETLRWVI